MTKNIEQKLKQIPKQELIKDRFYLGRGRNSNIGYWDGQNFLTIDFKSKNKGYSRIKVEGYYEKEYGCFQPFMLIPEGNMIEPFGKIAWDKHYGKTLLVKIKKER